MRRHIEAIESGVRSLGDWLRRAEAWQLIAVVILLLVILPTAPAIPVFLILAAIVLFARAWLREFAFLMRLGDADFPGVHDKLIWAMLMIVLPPVGLGLFRSYRISQWPETAKPVSPVHDLM
jgi:hypothetical protein